VHFGQGSSEKNTGEEQPESERFLSQVDRSNYFHTLEGGGALGKTGKQRAYRGIKLRLTKALIVQKKKWMKIVRAVWYC